MLLQLLSRHGRNLGSSLAKAIRRPVLIGLGLTLYVSWITHQTNRQLTLVAQSGVDRLSMTMLIASITWAVMNVGQTLLLSASMRHWIQIEDQQDEAMLINVLSRLYTILVLLIATAALMVNFGIPSAAIATVLGGAGIGFTFATQQISQNFLSGFMLFFNRPFKEGDWISVNNFEGTVESIGWYHTRLRTFSRRPMYIPNAMLITNTITNPGQMYNRRIKANIGLRHEDIPSMQAITADIQQMLENHPDIDQGQLILVNFTAWETASINLMVYCFTKTTVWKEYLKIQQDVFLNIANIIQSNHASFALNCTTVYPATNLNTNDLVRQLSAPNQGPEG